MILSPFPHRPNYRLREAAEQRAAAKIKRRMEALLAEFDRKTEAVIAKALRR